MNTPDTTPSGPPPSVFTSEDANPTPEPQTPPGPAAQADAKQRLVPPDAGRTDHLSPSAGGVPEFDLDESPEERTRRLARERKAAQREREKQEAWEQRKRESGGADGRLIVTDALGGMTYEQWMQAEYEPSASSMFAFVVTARGKFGFEPLGVPKHVDVHRAARIVIEEYGPDEFDTEQLREFLGNMLPGQTWLAPGGREWAAAEAERIRAAEFAKHEREAAQREKLLADNPDLANAEALRLHQAEKAQTKLVQDMRERAADGYPEAQAWLALHDPEAVPLDAQHLSGPAPPPE